MATVIKHIPKEELITLYKKEKNSRIKERLLAIIYLYDNNTLEDTSKLLNRSISSIKRWLRAWNNNGYNGLKPRFRGGRKPKLSYDEWMKILKEIDNKGYTIKDVVVYIKDSRGVFVAYKTVWRILRKTFNVKYSKPYIKNSNRPDNAEDIFKKD